MIPREAAPRLLRLLEGFPIVTVTGPRQSGKTTLVRSLLDDRPYVSLESPAEREFARAAPADFLRRYAGGAVIDEAQHAPELFSELQTVVDASGRMGRFVLTGSQNMALLSGIGQSLAGRTAVVELLPLSIGELRSAGQLDADYARPARQGLLPGRARAAARPVRVAARLSDHLCRTRRAPTRRGAGSARHSSASWCLPPPVPDNC